MPGGINKKVVLIVPREIDLTDREDYAEAVRDDYVNCTVDYATYLIDGHIELGWSRGLYKDIHLWGFCRLPSGEIIGSRPRHILPHELPQRIPEVCRSIVNELKEICVRKMLERM